MASISYSSPVASLTSINLDEPRHPFRQTAWLLIAALSVLAAACGGGSSSVMNPPPTPSAKDALYVSTGLTPNSLLTFVFDTATGTFGSPTAIAGAPAGIDTKVDPGGAFLYVSDFNSGSIFAYSIDRSTGALTALAGSPISFPGHTGNGGPIAIDPTGKFFSIPMPPAPSFPTPSILRPDSLPEPRRSSMTAISRFIFLLNRWGSF